MLYSYGVTPFRRPLADTPPIAAPYSFSQRKFELSYHPNSCLSWKRSCKELQNSRDRHLVFSVWMIRENFQGISSGSLLCLSVRKYYICKSLGRSHWKLISVSNLFRFNKCLSYLSHRSSTLPVCLCVLIHYPPRYSMTMTIMANKNYSTLLIWSMCLTQFNWFHMKLGHSA